MPGATQESVSATELQKMRDQLLRNASDVQQLRNYKRTDFRRQRLLSRIAELKNYSRLTKKNVSVKLQSQPKAAAIRVDTSKAHSNIDVVRLALQKLQWRECPNGNPSGQCEICWNGISFAENPGHPGGLVNKFPGMNDLLHKINLSRTIETLRQLFPDTYNFYPSTWYLPYQLNEFSAFVADSKHKETYIVKPDSGTQGGGIYLLREPGDYVHSSKSHVVQTYLSNPLLIDGYKFDLRVYVVLKSLQPLEIYVCKEGLARLCTQPYEQPNSKNMAEFFMHLTNYSLNKKSETYVHSDIDGLGSKRTLTSIFCLLESRGLDVGTLWYEIESLCIKTVIAVMPELMVCVNHELPPNKSGPKCFQILGFDIMILDNLKPMLLEVNNSPSLRLDYENELVPGISEYFVSVIDVQIKKPLVHDTLLLMQEHVRPLSYASGAGEQQQKQQQQRQQRPLKQLSILGASRRQQQQQQQKRRDPNRKSTNRDANDAESRGTSADTESTDTLHSSTPPKEGEEKGEKEAEEEGEKEEAAAEENGDVTCEVTGCQPQRLHRRRRRRNWVRANRELISAKSRARSALMQQQQQQQQQEQTEEGQEEDEQQQQQQPQHHPYDDEYWSDDDNCLEEVYPVKHKNLNQLRVLEGLTELFLAAIGVRTNLKLGATAFRNFARKCRLQQDSGISLVSLDILYIDLQRRWEYLSSDPSAGLCFQGFVEAFFKIARSRSQGQQLLPAVRSLIDHCRRCMGLVANEQKVRRRQKDIEQLQKKLRGGGGGGGVESQAKRPVQVYYYARDGNHSSGSSSSSVILPEI